MARLLACSILMLSMLLLPSAPWIDGAVAATKSNQTKKKGGKNTPEKSSSKKKTSKKPSKKKGSGKRRSKRARVVLPKRDAGELLSALKPVPIEVGAGLSIDPFFLSLEKLEKVRGGAEGGDCTVRILHFGDSHVGADYWSGEIRKCLQARFGDAGAGYVMPGKPWRFFRHELALSGGGKGWSRVGLGKSPDDGVLGLSRVSLAPVRKAEAAFVVAPCSYFEVQFAANNGSGGEVSIEVDGKPYYSGPACAEVDAVAGEVGFGQMSAGVSDWNLYFFRNREPLPAGEHRVAVVPKSPSGLRLMGMDFKSGRPGVIYDCLGINGTDIADMEKWAGELRVELLAHAAPSLVIISFGTNDMGAKNFDGPRYRELCARVIGGVKAELNGASLLVTGPMDRSSTSKSFAAKLDVRGAAVTEALRKAALDSDCAFWDAKAAMGGDGSIREWASAGLARTDFVHLSEAGYRQLGDMLYAALASSYDEWKGKRASAGQVEAAQKVGGVGE